MGVALDVERRDGGESTPPNPPRRGATTRAGRNPRFDPLPELEQKENKIARKIWFARRHESAKVEAIGRGQVKRREEPFRALRGVV